MDYIYVCCRYVTWVTGMYVTCMGYIYVVYMVFRYLFRFVTWCTIYMDYRCVVYMGYKCINSVDEAGFNIFYISFMNDARLTIVVGSTLYTEIYRALSLKRILLSQTSDKPDKIRVHLIVFSPCCILQW